ncbi:hypothetical protein DFH08DRAFT_970962 [Mycena albidolilacea]|uniref:Uncharacterized protein n=1 Tax=Mycena albidolilacea TaxID=1033008 RepID=A0AAD6ZE94_9AGAR|nr:hypothetical protein DFH08DRAFT_970962 [Mycena albidolilacea]
MLTNKNNVQRPPTAAKVQSSHDTARTTVRSPHPAPPRKGLQRADSQNTRYMNMLLALDGIPRVHNMLAAFFTWILLAGFVLLPGTFTSLQSAGAGANEKALIDAVQHVPLFVIAFVCSGIGVLGMLWLWWRWNQNYIWLNNRIFLCVSRFVKGRHRIETHNHARSPGALNSVAGIISTLVNVYSAQHGEFVETSKITIIVTVVSAVVCGGLTLLYSMVKLKSVREAHNRRVGRERAGRHGEGILEEIKRKANVIEPEAGIV